MLYEPTIFLLHSYNVQSYLKKQKKQVEENRLLSSPIGLEDQSQRLRQATKTCGLDRCSSVQETYENTDYNDTFYKSKFVFQIIFVEMLQ